MRSKKKNALYIVISVLVAIGLWIYVDSTQGTVVHKTVSGVPLDYAGEETVLAERGLMLLSDSETEVTLKLEGTKKLLAQLDTKELRVQADLSDVTKTGVQTVTYRVVYPDSKFSRGLTATSPTSFTATIHVGELYSRKVDVSCEIRGEVAEGYIAGEVVCDPSVLEIRGPQKDVDRISYAKVILNIEEAAETVSETLGYTFYDSNGNVVESSGIYATAKSVHVTLPVGVVKELPLVIRFKEAPGISENNISYTLNPESIMVSGDAAVLNGIEELVLDELDLSKLNSSGAEYNYTILMPQNCENLSGINRATLQIALKDITTASVNATRFEAVNAPEGKQVTILTDELPITLRGTAADVASVQPEQITVLADLQGVSSAGGTYTVPAEIRLNTAGNVGVIGTYQVTVNLSNLPEET